METISTRLSANARRTPHLDAIAFEGDRISWATLESAVDRLAARIERLVPPAAGVALSLPNGPALCLLLLASIRAGREAQILDPSWPVGKAQAVLAALPWGMLVTHEAGLAPAATLIADRLPFAAVPDALGDPAAFDPPAEQSAARAFYVGFTSGSTGLPKGFRRDQSSWLASFAADSRVIAIGPGDTVLVPGSMVHSNFVYAFLRAVYEGACGVLCRKFLAGAAQRLIAEREVTVLYCVPTQLRLLMEVMPGPAPGIRLVYSSGAKFPAEERGRVARQFPAADLCEYYGASETSFVTMTRPGDHTPPDAVGRPFPSVQVSIRASDGNTVPDGAVGLIYVESPLCFSGYVTGEPTVLRRAGSAMSIGDLGFLDPEGFLHLVGRADRMILSSGRNISPEEIEAVLEAHPAVSHAAVFGTTDAVRGERLTAVLQWRAEPMARGVLAVELRRQLAPYQIPAVIGVLASWRLTESGKTDFPAIARLYGDGSCVILE